MHSGVVTLDLTRYDQDEEQRRARGDGIHV